MTVKGRGDYVLKEKFRLIKEKMKWWNKTIFGKYDLEVEEGVRELNELDDNVDLNAEVLSIKRKASKRIWLNLNIKENMPIQMSTLKWLNDTDSISIFFHRVLKERRRRNHIDSIITSRGVVNSVREVKEAMKEHFEDGFVENRLNRPSLVGFEFNSLSLEDSRSLKTPSSEEEIKESMWSCDGSKSPGPDGMSIIFLKSCWYFIKKEVVACFKDFHSRAVLSKYITSSFLTLIPMVSNPLRLDDYRHICLVGSIYKIITKLLSSRIKKVLSSVISNCQSDFVLERQMIDGVLITNELVDYAYKEDKECLLFKVYFKKAYDKVNWNFLRFMLRKLGFGDIWMKWIEDLIFTSNMSVLVNGSPTKDLGWKEDCAKDPISPFLFVIVAEGLKLLVNKAVSNGDYAGCNVNGRCFVDVVQFADDTLMVGDGIWNHLWAIKAVLKEFELVSGLSIKFNKSKLIGININSHFMDVATSFLAFREESKEFIFLWILVGPYPRRVNTWRHLVDKIRKRLSSWNNSWVSFGGRITLIKSVLNSLAIFTLSFYKAPLKVIREINKIQSNFLWGKRGEV